MCALYMCAGCGEDQGVPVPGSGGKKMRTTRSIFLRKYLRKAIYNKVQ